MGVITKAFNFDSKAGINPRTKLPMYLLYIYKLQRLSNFRYNDSKLYHNCFAFNNKVLYYCLLRI